MTDTRRHFGGPWAEFGPKRLLSKPLTAVTPPSEPAPVDKRAGEGMRLWNDDVDAAIRATKAGEDAGVHYEPLGDEAFYGDESLEAVDVEGDYWKDEAGGWHRIGGTGQRVTLDSTYRGADGVDVRHAGAATQGRMAWDWTKPEWVFTCERCHTQIRARAAWKDAAADARTVGWQVGKEKPTLCPAHVKLKGGAK